MNPAGPSRSTSLPMLVPSTNSAWRMSPRHADSINRAAMLRIRELEMENKKRSEEASRLQALVRESLLHGMGQLFNVAALDFVRMAKTLDRHKLRLDNIKSVVERASLGRDAPAFVAVTHKLASKRRQLKLTRKRLVNMQGLLTQLTAQNAELAIMANTRIDSLTVGTKRAADVTPGGNPKRKRKTDHLS